MAFKKNRKASMLVKDPEALFRDLRTRTVEGLLTQQGDMLRAYMANIGSTDIALELPTGSGKTLVGLLIAEWRRRKNKERCIFLCPTKQLVHQVVEQAHEKYGIETLNFAGSKHSYSESAMSRFLNCEAIGIATYSSLFNSNPFFDDVSTIIFDDAHSAENYVSKCWSLEISRYKQESLFFAVTQLISPHIPEHDQVQLDDDGDTLDMLSINKLPMPYLLKIKSDLLNLLDVNCTKGENHFCWQMIRDNLHACHLYYTGCSILLRPIIPPTNSFKPFVNAKQRIYMSATLGEGGDLERIFGRKKITRIPAPVGWDKQGIGRRFFVFPMRVCDEPKALDATLEWINKFDRCLILTPRKLDADKIKEKLGQSLVQDGYTLFDSSELEASKKVFTQSPKGIAVLANRYDGIDLIGDECRYLVVYGLPEAMNMQERFLISRLAASVLFDVRIRTRVTQAVGRCTRSSTDWALVAVVGQKVHQYLMKPENRKVLHPELQAEVEFGIEQSDFTETNYFAENIDLFLEQGDAWQEVHNEILEHRDQLSQNVFDTTESLGAVVAKEVEYLNSYWNSHFEEALAAAKDVLVELTNDKLRGYRAWWLYLAGNAAFMAAKGNVAMREEAKRNYALAAQAAEALPWLKQLNSLFQTSPYIEDESDSDGMSFVIERLERQLDKLGKSNSHRIERKFKAIRDGLRSVSSSEFEPAQVLLGKLLGFEADNSSDQGAPDPWWILNEQIGVVFEDYTDLGKSAKIPKRKVLQAKGHPDTLQEKHPDIDFKPILCSGTDNIDNAALPHVDGVYYISVDQMRSFSEKALKVIREIWNSFPGPGDMNWRESAIQAYRENDLSPTAVLSFFTNSKLSDLIDSEG